jgi:hypothetical protein
MKSKAHLFPHSYLPTSILNKLISFIGPVTVYQPWFLEPSDSLRDIETINPPENLKPKADIKAILSGYRLWTEQNRDRGSREFLKFSKKNNKDDGSSWEIRRLLKAGADPSLAAKEEERTLKWHIILHLAHEVERQNFEVRDMMDSLKKRGPVLAGALQEPYEAKGFIDDTLELEQIDVRDTLNIGLILDAWFGLFSGYLEKDAVLITCNSHVMDYISTRWNEDFAINNDASPQTVSFNLPLLSSSELHSENRIEADARAAVMKMRELIFGFGENLVRSINGFNALAEEPAETQKPSEATSNISMVYFPAREMMTGRNSIIKNVMGKTIIFLSS